MCEAHVPRQADISYLRILHLAATTMQADVEVALELLLEQGHIPEPAKVKALVSQEPEITVPSLARPQVDLTAYNDLVPAVAAEVRP